MTPQTRIELVIDGVVHYDKIIKGTAIAKKLEELKHHVERTDYKENFELAMYVKSKMNCGYKPKLGHKEKQHAISLLERFPLNTIAKRFNIAPSTLRRYAKEEI